MFDPDMIEAIVCDLGVRYIDLEFKEWTPDEIKEFRSKYRLYQHSIADLLGVTRLHVHYLETGKRTPSNSIKILLSLWEFYLHRKIRKEREY